jgi:hypothetical protein
MTRPTYYKWLSPQNAGVYGHGDYTDHLPHGKRPGKWLPPIADPRPCARGYHVVTASHLFDHWGREGSVLYVAEVRGAIATDTDKLACEQTRLVERVGVLTRGVLVTFAADCAARVLPIFEAKFPDDDRPRKAIEAARLGAVAAAAARAADAANAAYAHAAAYAAANAAYAAAAAANAAANAAYAAAYAAYAAAYAARAAANAAYAAARAADAAYAARAADAARAAAYAKERAWQGRHLLALLRKDACDRYEEEGL